MAKAVSAEELELRKRARRRLLGAIALVLLAVIFLPMVLDSEPRPVTQDVVIQIPSQNQGQFVSKIVPVTPEVKPAPRAETRPADKDLAKSEAGVLAPSKAAPPAGLSGAAAPKVSEASAQAAPESPKAAPGSTAATPREAPKPKAAAAKPAPAAKTDAKAPAKGAPAAEQFVVQVAALSDTAKAQTMREQIAAAGFAAYTESVPTASGPVMRVRAGPFPSRAAAEAARDKLKAAGMAGNVTTK